MKRWAPLFLGLLLASACGKKPPKGDAPRKPAGAEPTLLVGPPSARPAPRKGMAWVDGGALVAGTPLDRLPRIADEELTGEQVILSGFYIDILPFPNEEGAIPLTNVTQAEARGLCEERDKRLCSELEWERACKGPDNLTYEYGDRYRADRCGTGQAPSLKPSGLLVGCTSDFGVRDLHGGVFEWTDSAWNRGGVMHLSTTRGGNGVPGELVGRCAHAVARPPSAKLGTLGFRCCAGPRNTEEVGLTISRGPRVVPEPSVDQRLLGDLLEKAPPALRSEFPEGLKFIPSRMWRWNPIGNDRLTVYSGCWQPAKVPSCGALVGREARLELLAWAPSGYRLPSLHHHRESSDVWLLGGDARGPFSRRISYRWGELRVLEPARTLPKGTSQ